LMAVVPDSINFGSELLGSHHDTTIVIHNEGTYSAHVTSVLTPAGYSTTFTGDVLLPPLGNTTTTIRFDPPTEGQYNDTVWVISTAPDSPTLVRVYGTCIAATQILVTTPDSINFGSLLVGAHRDSVLHIQNVGTAPTHLTSIEPPQGFSTTYIGDHLIQPGQEITAVIRFQPDSAQVYDDSLRLISTSPDSPTLVPVRGVGLASGTSSRSGVVVPHKFALSAFPNPFNPVTELRFDVPRAGHVTLAVYDVDGRLVETLAKDVFAAGEYAASFDGSRLASGTYFARMEAYGFDATAKLVLMK